METKFKTVKEMVKKILAVSEKLGKQSETLGKVPISCYYAGVLAAGDNEYEVQIGTSWFRIDDKRYYIPFFHLMGREERKYKKALAIQRVLESLAI